nr:MAG TPA: hypothetical protein [Caudoviricetes sp.]
MTVGFHSVRLRFYTKTRTSRFTENPKIRKR